MVTVYRVLLHVDIHVWHKSVLSAEIHGYGLTEDSEIVSYHTIAISLHCP
jgi:hypothetical protein